jgi:riboflavin kinase/FMN adenylyltransferase
LPAVEVITVASRPGVEAGCAVTIGAYDGVHRGHQAVIRRTQAEARRHHARTAVVTFDRHPAAVVRPDSAPKLLTTLEQKLELLAGLGVDYTYVVHFDDERASESAEDFVQEVLVDVLRARCVVVGRDFHFGNGRRGNVAMLTELGAQLGFETIGLELVAAEVDVAHVVSSTAIRKAVSAGDVDTAAAMLGRPHELWGTVVTGDRRGRTLGFPTANVAVTTDLILPGDGIYAGWYLRPDGARHATAINVGRRPTFYDDAPASLVEAFLLDFVGDLYGEAARVQFIRRLRPELKFDSVDALVAQMQADVAEARTVLGC